MTARATITIADAIVETINDEATAVAGQTVVAERLYTVALDQRDMATVHCSVVPRSTSETPRGRGVVSVVAEIDIAIQKRCESVSQADALMDLVDTVLSLFRLGELDELGARNVKLDRVLFDSELMERNKLFCAVATLTWTFDE